MIRHLLMPHTTFIVKSGIVSFAECRSLYPLFLLHAHAWKMFLISKIHCTYFHVLLLCNTHFLFTTSGRRMMEEGLDRSKTKAFSTWVLSLSGEVASSSSAVALELRVSFAVAAIHSGRNLHTLLCQRIQSHHGLVDAGLCPRLGLG